MENNKYNNYYSRKTISELILELRQWKRDTTKADWYEALKLHLLERELTGEEKSQVDYIINTDNKILIQEEKAESTKQEKDKQIENIPIVTETEIVKKISNINESLTKNNKSIEQKLESLAESLISINAKMRSKILLYISLVIFNVIMFAVLKNSVEGNFSNTGEANNPQTASTIIIIMCMVDAIIAFIIMVIEFSIIEKFGIAGEELKKK